MVASNMAEKGSPNLKSAIGIPGADEKTIAAYFDVAHSIMGNPS